MKKGVKEAAAESAKSFLRQNLDRVAEEAVDYLYENNPAEVILEAFNTEEFPEMEDVDEQRSHLLIFTKELIKAEFFNAPNRM